MCLFAQGYFLVPGGCHHQRKKDRSRECRVVGLFLVLGEVLVIVVALVIDQVEVVIAGLNESIGSKGDKNICPVAQSSGA